MAYFNRHPCMTKGLVEWELVNPITFEEATKAIKGMSDGAPGPDRRSPSDLKQLRREEVAAHFNVWLLAGFPPAPLRRAPRHLRSTARLHYQTPSCGASIRSLLPSLRQLCRGTGARGRL